MYLIQTVQATWRPPLPLPKDLKITDEQPNDDELKSKTTKISVSQYQKHSANNDNNDQIIQISEDMERLRKDNNNSLLSSSTQLSNKQKWSFGRLFRKKKEIELESSSEEDRKAGFIPAQKYARSAGNNSSTSAKSKSKHKTSRSNKLTSAGFDHILTNPTLQSNQPLPQKQHVDNEFFLPVETITGREPYYQNQQQLPNCLSQMHNLAPQPQCYSRSTNSLDRRAMLAVHGRAATAPKSRSAQRLVHGASADGLHSSSEEEIISLNSATFAKYRSDESIHSGGQAMQSGQSRRSRAARNERYFKRLSRDGEPCHGGVPVMYAQGSTQRWKTQPVPLSIYQAPQQRISQQQQQQQQQQQLQQQRLRNTTSLQNMAPYVQWNQMQQQLQQQQQSQQPPSKDLQNTVNDAKRSISYDNHIHLQNLNGRTQSKPLPPPPPPRDPLRRVNVSLHSLYNGSSGELRPVSYAFDQCGVPVLPNTVATMNTTGMGGRCVSDDRIWQPQMPHFQSVHSLNMPSQQQQSGHIGHRRFITRAERDANPAKKSLPNGIDFHYITDAAPRSRKPIHMLEQSMQTNDPPSSGILRTSKSGLPTPAPPPSTASDFWQRLDEGVQCNTRGRDNTRSCNDPVLKPRSISSSRVGELRSYPTPIYSEVHKPNRKPVAGAQVADEVENVICSSLHIKPGSGNVDSYVEIRNKDMNKSHSMPHHYQRRSGEVTVTPNKYDEYVAEKRTLHAQSPRFATAPPPPQRKQSAPQIYFQRKKPANLEEAINELEAIYKSLGLSEEPEKRERVPTPSEFEKFALAHADEYDDDDSPTGEPDLVRDDVAYRNLQLANLQHKTAEKQPPFGIPIGPIVPAPQSDYLHVRPEEAVKKTIGSPDIIKDDLAVRTLRKDPPGPKQHFVYPAGALQKKNRAIRTQSANIYSLIQRDAAKPAGGDLLSYVELTRTLDRAGSLSDIHKDESTKDIPATLNLLRKIKAQDEELKETLTKKVHIPFRHPSQGGAICQLPERLTSNLEVKKAPIPLPRSNLTPEPLGNSQMDDALNKIAQDAQESSIKLSKELQELRKEALISAARPKLNAEEQKLEQELQQIEAVSEAAKRCGKMLLDTLPDAHENATGLTKPARKLHKEGKLIKAIDQVSEAANAVCEKILKDIVTTELPVVVQEAVKVKQPLLPPTSLSPSSPVASATVTEEPELVMPNLIKKLDPIQSDKIEAIARRCMRQLSELAENADYDNLAQPSTETTTLTAACNMPKNAAEKPQKPESTFISTVAEVHPTSVYDSKAQMLEEIDKIIQECEAKARGTKVIHSDASNAVDEQRTTAPSVSSSGGSAPNAPNASTTASSFSSSSDCLAKSSSPTNASRRLSSSITSFNPYSSSDYVKSPSSEYHALSTDPIKTFSTTSYDVQSTSATPNITSSTANTTANSTHSYTPSPSPPLNLTPVSARRTAGISATVERARSSSPSQYNSSEELAMIFGIEEKPKQRYKSQQQQQKQQQQLQEEEQQQAMPINNQLTGKTSVGTLHDSSLKSTKNNNTNITSAATTNPPAAIASAVTSVACIATPVRDILTVTNSTFNIDEVNIDVITTSSPTNVSTASNSSTSSFKLATIPELHCEKEPEAETECLMLSPNFNKIYASKISIVIDKPTTDGSESLAINAVSALAAPLTQFDSLSSLEEICSNPDSGNVSLADFPLAAQSNASFELQPSYNSCFEIREHYVSEVSIRSVSPAVNCEEEFPRLPTEEELLLSLCEEDSELATDEEISDETESTSRIKTKLNEPDESLLELLPMCRKNIVFETPQLNLNISEVKLSYEEKKLPVIEEKLQQRSLDETLSGVDDAETLETEKTKRKTTKNANDITHASNESISTLAARNHHQGSDDDEPQPSTSAKASLSIFGEVRPMTLDGAARAEARNLTTLEHLLIACTVGLITPNDLLTLCLIIIGVVLIVAIALA